MLNSGPVKTSSRIRRKSTTFALLKVSAMYVYPDQAEFRDLNSETAREIRFDSAEFDRVNGKQNHMKHQHGVNVSAQAIENEKNVA